MKWPLALLFSALLLTGCYNQRYNFDPFLGRSRVAPPGTGQIAPPMVQPYYQDGATPGLMPAPAAAPGLPQSSLRQTDGPRAAEIRSNDGVVDLDGQVDTAWSRPKAPWTSERSATFVVGPTGEADGAVLQVSHNNPAAFADTERPAGAGQPSLGTAADAPQRLIIPDDTAPISTTAPQKAAGDQRLAKYGYDADYASLRGRLEFLEGRQQWKLRYIPIDGDTDRFGGSVVIADTSALADFKPGDFVSVVGTVDQSSASSRSFAPTYVVQQIRPAANLR